MNIRRKSPQSLGSVLMRIDWDSNVLWQKDIPVHHDVAQAPDGTFYTLFREVQNHRDLRVEFCGIVHLEDGGEEIERWSTYQHLDDIMSVLDTRSFLDTVLDSAVLERGTYRLLWSWGIEVDPERETIVWEYTARPPEDFYYPTRGSSQRLKNGNALICESDKGRAFEVTPKGEIVWMWLNPETVGDVRKTVYRMIRHPLPVIERLLGGG